MGASLEQSTIRIVAHEEWHSMTEQEKRKAFKTANVLVQSNHKDISTPLTAGLCGKYFEIATELECQGRISLLHTYLTSELTSDQIRRISCLTY